MPGSPDRLFEALLGSLLAKSENRVYPEGAKLSPGNTREIGAGGRGSSLWKCDQYRYAVTRNASCKGSRDAAALPAQPYASMGAKSV